MTEPGNRKQIQNRNKGGRPRGSGGVTLGKQRLRSQAGTIAHRLLVLADALWKQARIELSKPSPDRATIQKAFDAYLEVAPYSLSKVPPATSREHEDIVRTDILPLIAEVIEAKLTSSQNGDCANRPQVIENGAESNLDTSMPT